MTTTDSDMKHYDGQTGGLTAAHLKVIAAVTMFIDHMGAVLFPHAVIAAGGFYWPWLRIIGRLSFPIYAFLLAEGVRHTRDIRKYFARVFILALISEPIYDLTFYGRIFFTGDQSILFTLSLAVAMLGLCRRFYGVPEKFFLRLGLLAIFGSVAQLFKCNYGFLGMAVIWIFSEERFPKEVTLVGAGAVQFVFEGDTQPFAAAAMIPIAYYNGQLGWRNRGFQLAFYAFYPAHILLLLVLRTCVHIW